MTSTVIYVDVLVALNVIITYIFICSARRLARFPTRKGGVVASSFVGGVSSLIIFADNLGVFPSLLYKAAVASVIVLLAFFPKTLKGFLKCEAYFLGVSFLFAGIMLGVEIAFSPPNMRYMNGAVYFDMSLTFLVGCVLTVYGVLTVAERVMASRFNRDTLCEVTVSFRGGSVALNALYDTGNTAKDLLNGKPLVIAETQALAGLFTYEELKYLKADDWSADVPGSLKALFHAVPCSSVGGGSLLKAFLPDRIEVCCNGKVKNTVPCVIALTPSELSDGEYVMLLNADIFSTE